MGKKSTKPRAVLAPAQKPAPAEPEKPATVTAEGHETAGGSTPKSVTAPLPAKEPAPKPTAARAKAGTKGESIGEKEEPSAARSEQTPSRVVAEPATGQLHEQHSGDSRDAPVAIHSREGRSGFLPLLQSIKRGFVLFYKEIKDKESLRFLGIALFVIAVSIGIAFLLGQATYLFLETNASNAGHLYGIITSAIAFFFFARYLRNKKDILYVRRFLVVYFIIYFSIVMLILAFLQGNAVYFLSTLGNSFILFSAYTLIIFILNPEILGVLGTGGNIRRLFLSGQHVRLIIIYLFIAVMQVTGFSLLDYAVQIYSEGGTLAYIGVPGGGTGTWFDFFYFSMITFVTIGYGDMHPALPVSELSSTIQALLSHVISILFLAVLLLYLSSSAPATSDKDQKSV